MSTQEIVTTVQNLGVSVCMLGASCWFVKYMFDKFMTEMEKERASHESDMDAVTQALNNNTEAVIKLTSYIQVKGGENV